MRNRPGQNGETLPQIAMDVRMVATGAMEENPEDTRRKVFALREALATWEPSREDMSAAFDEAVRVLCYEALKAWGWRHAERMDEWAQQFDCSSCDVSANQASHACRVFSSATCDEHCCGARHKP